MSRRSVTLLSWSLFGLTVALTVAGALVEMGARTAMGTVGTGFNAADAVELAHYLTMPLAFAGIGSVIAHRFPDNALGWIFCVAGVAISTLWAAESYGRYAFFARPGALPAGAEVLWISNWCWVPASYLPLVFLPLLFPNGHLLSPRWRIVAWTAVAAMAMLVLIFAFQPGGFDEDEFASIANPFGIDAAGGILNALAYVAYPLAIGCSFASVVALVLRVQRSSGIERQQLKWFVFVGIVTIGLLLIAAGANAAGNPSPITDSALSLSLSGFPLAAGMAMLRYRLYDIDLIINRTLLYVALTVCVGGIYILAVSGLGTVVQSRRSFWVSLVATGLVAVLFQPLRMRLQQTVNRLLYGERDDPYAVLTRLSRRLDEALTPAAMLPAIVGSVSEALRLPYAAIALWRGEVLSVVAMTGTPVATPVRFPLSYGAEPVGELVLAPRAPGKALDPRDRRLIEDLARQIGIAAHAVRLTADLQLAREHLVTTREEERRRLRRDLHDGLGPALGAQTLKVGAARSLLAVDPRAAEKLLAQLEADLQAATIDIRRLVYDLRPPSLDELGLAEAIREAAARFVPLRTGDGSTAGVGPQIAVDAPERLPPLPAAVEVAAYRIAHEALTNVVRHARARTCIVRLALADAALRVEVIDDGDGLPEGFRAGVGLASMRERAAELNGTCLIETPATGGTRVVVRLPLPDDGDRTAAHDGRLITFATIAGSA